MSVKNNSAGKYYVKTGSDSYADITTMFAGVAVLSVDGFNEKGEAQNVCTQKWIESTTEDFCIVGSTIIRANVDLKMTFIVSRRYVDDTYTPVQSPTGNPRNKGYYEYSGGAYRPTWDTSVVSGKTYYTRTPATVIDEQAVYDTFTNYICGSDFYIKSLYTGKEAHVVCQKGVKISSQKLQRGDKSYILATAELHTLDVPQSIVQQGGQS